MAFRNPITSLPGTAITGPINGAQLVTGSVGSSALAVGSVTTNKLAAGAITGQTITGGMIQTSTSGARIVIDGPSDTESIYDSAGDVTGYLGGPNGIIGNYQPGDNEFSALANGSVYVGLGMPAGFVTSGAGILGTLADGSTVLQGGQAKPSQLQPASLHLIPGVNGTDAPGSANLPRILVYDANGGVTDLLVSSAVIKSDGSGTLETWQAPAYQTNWAAATAMGTLTGLQSLHFHKDPLDNLVIGGCFAAGATAPGTAVLMLPAAYRPKQAYALIINKITGGVASTAMCYISTAGNLNLNTQLGSTVTASAQYIIPPQSIPLGNLT